MTIKTWERHFAERRSRRSGRPNANFNSHTYKIYYQHVKRSFRAEVVTTIGVAPPKDKPEQAYLQYLYAGGAETNLQPELPNQNSRPPSPNAAATTERPKTGNAFELKVEATLKPPVVSDINTAASGRPTTPIKPSTPIASRIDDKNKSDKALSSLTKADANCCNTLGCCGCCVFNPIYDTDLFIGGLCKKIGEETSACINDGDCCFVEKDEAEKCKGEACKIVCADPCFLIGDITFCLNKTMSVIQRAECPSCSNSYCCCKPKVQPEFTADIIRKKGADGKTIIVVPGNAKKIRPGSAFVRQSSAASAGAAAKYAVPARPFTAGSNRPITIDTGDQKSDTTSPENVGSPAAAAGSPTGVVIKTSTAEIMTLTADTAPVAQQPQFLQSLPAASVRVPAQSTESGSAATATATNTVTATPGGSRSGRKASAWNAPVVSTRNLSAHPGTHRRGPSAAPRASIVEMFQSFRVDSPPSTPAAPPTPPSMDRK